MNTGYKSDKHFITIFKENGALYNNPLQMVGSHAAFFNRNKNKKRTS